MQKIWFSDSASAISVTKLLYKLLNINYPIYCFRFNQVFRFGITSDLSFYYIRLRIKLYLI